MIQISHGPGIRSIAWRGSFGEVLGDSETGFEGDFGKK